MAENPIGEVELHLNSILPVVWNNSSDGFRITNKSGIVIDVNNVYAEMVGFSKDQIINSVFTDSFISEQRKELLENYSNLFLDEASSKIEEKKLYLINGEEKYFSINYAVINEKNDPIVLSIFKSISNKLPSIDSEHEVMEKYHTLITQAADGIYLADPTGKFIDVNPAGCKMIGYSLDEIKKLSIVDVVDSEDIKKNPLRFDELKAGKNLLTERKLIRKDGSIKDVEINTKMLSNGMLQGIVRDITERKTIEKQILENQQKYRSLFENMIDGFAYHEMLYDKLGNPIDYIFLQINHSFEIYFKVKRDNILQKKVSDVFPDITNDDFNFIAEYGEIAQSGNSKVFEQYSSKLNKWFKVRAYSIKKNYFATIYEDITSTKLTHYNLAKSEETLRSMAESINDGLTIIEADKVVFFNRKVLEIFDTTPERYLKRDEIDYAIDDDIDKIKRIRKNVIENTIVQNEVSFWIRTDTGQKKHITNRYSPTVKSGKRAGLVIITSDTTAEKKALDEVKRSQTRLKLLFNSTYDFIAMLNRNAAPVWVNESFKNMFGVKFEARNKPFSIFHPDDAIDAERLWSKMRYSRKPIRNVILRLNVSHTIKYFEISAYPSAASEEDYYFVFAKDITERVNTEKELNKFKDSLQDMVDQRTAALRYSEEKYRALAENSQDVIMRFDDQLRHIYVNPEVKNHTGIDAKDFINRTHEELGFPKHLTDLWKKVMKKVFRTGIESRIEFKLPNNNWIDWVVIPEFDNKGKVKSLVTSGRDITSRKQMEMDVVNSLQREKELSDLKSRFISTTSHEFRTPLTSIKSSADIIRRYGENYTREQIIQHVDKISKAVDKMTIMISEVMKVSKSEITKESFYPVQINLHALINSVIANIKQSAEKGINIIFDSSIENNTYVLDEELMTSVIQNLLSNSVKYNRNNSNIEIIAKSSSSLLTISVIDEGIGIAPEDQKVIFEPFIRAKNIGDVEGTGLGLSIVKNAIEIHGGTIKLLSKINVGSEFIIELPLSDN